MDVQPPNKLASCDRIQISPLAKHQLKHPYLLIFETLLQQIFPSSVIATKILSLYLHTKFGRRWTRVFRVTTIVQSWGVYFWELLVELCRPNPGAISDQKMSFFTPVFRPDLKNPYLFLDLTFRQELCHHYLD